MQNFSRASTREILRDRKYAFSLHFNKGQSAYSSQVIINSLLLI